ncbi:hypothetical protein GCM10027452_00400 [Micromonospora halotolerans]
MDLLAGWMMPDVSGPTDQRRTKLTKGRPLLTVWGTQGAQDTVKRRQRATSDGNPRRRVSRCRWPFTLVAGERLYVPLQLPKLRTPG